MFLTSLNLLFNLWFCNTPLFYWLFDFFVSSFILNLLVCIHEPKLFKFLFSHICCWVIVLISRFPFEPVLSLKHYWLSSCIEAFKRMWICWFFYLIKVRLCLSCHLSLIIVWKCICALLKQALLTFLIKHFANVSSLIVS